MDKKRAYIKFQREAVERNVRTGKYRHAQEAKENRERLSWLKCDVCGVWGPDVNEVADPYTLDIEDREVWRYLCDECYQDSCDSI